MEIAATNDFLDLISDVVASVRLREGRCSAVSPDLRQWQAERYSERADEALNDWLGALEDTAEG